MTEINQVQSNLGGDPYYENVVFKKIDETGKIPMNWWAFFFGCYWLSYKGLFKETAIWYGGFAIIALVLEVLGYAIVVRALGFGLCGGLAYYANKYRYDAFKKGHNLKKGSVLHGIIGTVLVVIILTLSAGIGEQIRLASTSNAASASSSEATEDSNVAALEFLDLFVDFDKYVGKEVVVEGISTSLGEQIAFQEKEDANQMIFLDISAIDRNLRKSLYGNCDASYCEITLKGVPFMSALGKSMKVMAVE